MPACPNDGTPLDADYGMIACPACGSILFVDMDGNAHLGADPAIESAPVAAPSIFESQLPEPEYSSPEEDPLAILQPSNESGFESVQTEDQFAGEIAEPSSDSSPDSNPDSGPVPQEARQESDGGDQGIDMDQLLGYAEDSADPAQLGGPGDPLGIQGYANSELSQAKDGPLLFKVLVEGIDSKEIRDALREALEDGRFAWDVAEIMSSISKGRLQIDDVSPVKATILINRIKRLPVRIFWEQYAITQSESY